MTGGLRADAATAAVLILLLPAAAVAGEGGGAPWHLDLEAQTAVPVDVGARASLEMPHRLRATTSLGWMPGGYLDLVNEVLVGAGAYPESTANLIDAALSDALVWRLQLGWRPLPRYGFYFEAGYALAALGGGLTTEEMLLSSGGSAPSQAERGLGRGYDLKAVVHMVTAEVGYQWVLWGRISLRAFAGFAGTVGAQVGVAPDFTPRTARGQEAVDAFVATADSYLTDQITSYVFTPVVGVAVGWRAF